MKRASEKISYNNSSGYTTEQTNSTFSSKNSLKNQEKKRISFKSKRSEPQIDINPYTTFAKKSEKHQLSNKNPSKGKISEVEDSLENSKTLVEEVLRSGAHLIKNNSQIFKDQDVTKRQQKMHNERKMKTIQSSPILQNKPQNILSSFENIKNNLSKVYHPKSEHPGFEVESLGNSTNPLSTFHNSTFNFTIKNSNEKIKNEGNNKYYGLEDTREGTKEDMGKENNMIFADEFELQNIGNSAGNEFGIESSVVLDRKGSDFDKGFKVSGYPKSHI